MNYAFELNRCVINTIDPTLESTMIFFPNASPLSSFHRDDKITDFSSARVFGSAKKSISKT